MRAVSLFSNCGAGDVGYRRAGFQFDVMAELEPKRLAVALLNHPQASGVAGDLRETWVEVVRRYRGRAGSERPALLAACPPCQGLSSARGKRGTANDADSGTSDPRNLLVLPIAHVARELKPSAIVVENVPAFLQRRVWHPWKKVPISAARLLIELLSVEYRVFPFLSDLADFGIPQTRKRSFLTFIRQNEQGLGPLLTHGLAPYPKPTHAPDHGGRAISLGAALDAFGLAPLDASAPDAATDPDRDPLHQVPVWDAERYEMVDAIPPGTGRTAWQNDTCGVCNRDGIGSEEALCPDCNAILPRPVIRGRDGVWRLIRGFRTSSYKRMNPEFPAATVTTASGHVGSHSTLHPTQNRVFSTRECALLQTFPKNFAWGPALELWGHTNVRAMIGEAVPPHFTFLHGLAVRSVLTNDLAARLILRSDRRCVRARQRLLSAKARTKT